MTYLEVHNLHKRFLTPGGQEVKALNGVSFEIDRGEILCVVGHNGSGKTTLLNCLRRTFSWDEGAIRINGKVTGDNSVNIVSVFQDVGLGVVGSMTPTENLSLAFSKHPGFINSFPNRRFEEQINILLKDAGLQSRFKSFGNTSVSELSGGQRQQVAIMMAVLRQPDLLLLDEFVANLDPKVKMDILSWMRIWIQQNKITTVMVTHDMNMAENLGDWILELLDGKVIRFKKTKNYKN